MNNRRNLTSLALSGLLIGSLATSGYAQRGAKSASGIEKSLAGIRILQSYKSVLARYGAPTRIFAADELVDWEYSHDAKGELTGGIKGILGSVGGGGATGGGGGKMGAMGGDGGGIPGGPPASMMGGMMGARMPGGMSGGGGGGIPGGPPASMMGAMMGARMPAGVMPGMSGGGGAPGMGGGMSGAMPGAMPGGGGAGATLAKSGSTYGDRGGFLWVYLDTRLEKATEFLFNKDGRLEAIAERGRIGGSITSRGITLGSKIQDVYGAYGWPEKTQPSGGSFLSLHYLQKNHLQLITLKDKARNEISVVGLVVVLRENQKLNLFDGNGAGGGGATNPALAAGRMGGGGIAGRAFPGAAGMSGGGGFAGMMRGGGRKGGGGEE